MATKALRLETSYLQPINNRGRVQGLYAIQRPEGQMLQCPEQSEGTTNNLRVSKERRDHQARPLTYLEYS